MDSDGRTALRARGSSLASTESVQSHPWITLAPVCLTPNVAMQEQRDDDECEALETLDEEPENPVTRKEFQEWRQKFSNNVQLAAELYQDRTCVSNARTLLNLQVEIYLGQDFAEEDQDAVIDLVRDVKGVLLEPRAAQSRPGVSVRLAFVFTSEQARLLQECVWNLRPNSWNGVL